jgi:hypothetical protein
MTIPDLVHAANVRFLTAVALPPRLGFVKTRPMVLRPTALWPSLRGFHPVEFHERAPVSFQIQPDPRKQDTLVVSQADGEGLVILPL